MSRPRRTLLAGAGALATWPWLAGCDRAPAEIAGGWVGADAERGHALRDGRLPRAGAGAARRCSVAIVGAGVAGLAAARALRQAGIDDFRVFELEDGAGGNARGHTMDGMRCPLGAHYLPLPGPEAHEVAEWLHEIGIARIEAGRTVFDERQLCHAPQERIFVAAEHGVNAAGGWHEGLLPLAGAGAGTLAQLRRFAGNVQALQRALSFAMPTLRSRWSPGLGALDAQTFGAWLTASGYDDATLRAYLDYCCRDDYGAGLGLVSAWAGLHYFASRHGFHVPGDEAAEPADAVLTWPEGNARLTERLAQGLGERLQTGAVLTRIAPTRHETALEVWNVRAQQPQRWIAQQVVVCVPLFIAARLLDAVPAPLAEIAPRLAYAPWLVTNLQLREPLFDRPGPAPAWDNVIAGSPALGYVDAMHQSLRPVPGPTVLTHYWALGGQSLAELQAARARLLKAPWTAWRDAVLADLLPAHLDLPRKLVRIDAMRYGHAMIVPTPGLRGDPALAALGGAQGRLHFAHADLSAGSVFEEAFTRGTLAGRAVARAFGGATNSRRPT
ncbi:FAD-dependent oxidoreductase [Methylibium sp.]|uniref:FAD-dependent oxidoreductase n=1 Tax=Methylibium sp. TaxID=2067992 RepID=UPI003D0E4974